MIDISTGRVDMKTKLESNEPALPFDLAQPKRPFSRAWHFGKPRRIEEVRLGGFVELWFGPEFHLNDEQICGPVVWIDLATSKVVVKIADEVMDPTKTGLLSGQFVEAHLEQIAYSEFSEQSVWMEAERGWSEQDEAILRQHGFYAANPKYDFATKECQDIWRGLRGDDQDRHIKEKTIAKQEFLNRWLRSRLTAAQEADTGPRVEAGDNDEEEPSWRN
jgi:hypothetical protein